MLSVAKIKQQIPTSFRNKLPKEIGVVKISVAESRKLNLVYRDKDKPTNVLSFYYNPDYGEVLLCPEVIKKEALDQGHSQDFQMTWMMVHGIIHLAGLHHENSQLAESEFSELEKKILSQIFKKETRD